jgi:hypothetical protein
LAACRTLTRVFYYSSFQLLGTDKPVGAGFEEQKVGLNTDVRLRLALTLLGITPTRVIAINPHTIQFSGYGRSRILQLNATPV